MPRETSSNRVSDVKREIKKKWLEQHLEEVETLAGEWLGQLFLANPFYPFKYEEEWKDTYQPPVECDADRNHMLRRHVRSRTLWAYHAKWQQLLREFTALRKETLQEAKRLGEGKGEYWILTALWQAFERAKNPPRSEDEEGAWELRMKSYYRLDSPSSTAVMFGGFATGEMGDVGEVRQLHLDMVRRLAGSDHLREAHDVWANIEDLGQKMSGIGGRILKAHDILYSCRYCRHLWK